MPTITVSIATPAVVGWTAHGLNINDPISFTTTGTLPTGVSTNTAYYVKGSTATVTTPIASPGVVNWTGHGLGSNSKFSISGGTLPAPLLGNTIYYVLYVDANTFQLATTPGGTALNFTGTSSGTQTGVGLPLDGFNIAATVAGANINTSGSQSGVHAGLTFVGLVESSTWVTPRAYLVGQRVVNSGSTYTCLIAHTSGTFATDLANGNWRLTPDIVLGSAMVTVNSVALAVNISLSNIVSGSEIYAVAGSGGNMPAGTVIIPAQAVTTNPFAAQTKYQGPFTCLIANAGALYAPYLFADILGGSGYTRRIEQQSDQ